MSLPRMSLHIGDYKRDTGHLRAAEHGAYILLIMHYWSTGGLPLDDRGLSAIACMTDREWKAARPTLAAFFGPEWKHKRIEVELKTAAEKYERNVSNGKKGGRPKKEPNPKPRANPEVISGLTQNEPDGKATLTNKEKKEEIDIARAKTPMIRPEAHSLSDDCYRALGIEIGAIPPEWCALAYQIEMMLSRGYDPPNILGVADRLGRHRPLKPMNYFVKCVESSQQNQIKPAGAPNAKSGNVVQAADRLLAKLAYFDEPAPESARVCSGEGQNPIRAISQR